MIRIKPYGRMGNQVMQTTAAIAYALDRGAPIETNPIPPILPPICMDGHTDESFESDFYEHDVPACLTHDLRRMIARMHLAPRLLVQPIPSDPDTLTIHLRSDDTIWNQVTHSSMVQPPLAFYRRIIKDGRYESILIVAEDDKHPCLLPLTRENFAATFVGNAATAYAHLLGAVNLVPAYSTFSQTASMLSPCIKRMYLTDTNIFQYLGRVPLPTWCEVHKYFLRGYTPAQTWRASPEQLKLMVDFPMENVERVEEFT